MKHSKPIGPASRTTQVVADGSDADDAEVGVEITGSPVVGPHPSSSPQSDEAALRFSCAGSGGAPGHPHVFGNSRHSKLIHCPA